MPLSEVNEYKDFEYCLTPDNSAIRQARKLINRVCVSRAKKEDQYNNLREQQEAAR